MNNADFVIQNEGGHTFFLYPLRAGYSIDAADAGWMPGTPFPGAAPCSVLRTRDATWLQYDLSGQVPLRSYLEKTVDRKNFLTAALRIVENISNLDRNRLDRKYLLLDKNIAFIQPQTGWISLLYLPVTGIELPACCLKDFFLDIVFSSRFSASEDYGYVKNLLSLLNSRPEVTTGELKELLRSLLGIAAPGPSPQKTAPDQSRYFSASEAVRSSAEVPAGQELGGTVLLGTQGAQKMAASAVQNSVRAVLTRKKTGVAVQIEGPVFRLGKAKNAVDCVIGENPAVSRHHADILVKDGSYFLIDRRSSNGTFVNGHKIAPDDEVVLHDGNIIRLADEDFTFSLL